MSTSAPRITARSATNTVPAMPIIPTKQNMACATIAAAWEGYLEGIRKAGSSVGAIIEVVAEGIPAGLGAPVYAKLDNELASALMSINAVKGVEIGDGFATAAMSGEENA